MTRCTTLAMLLIVSPAFAEPIPKESEAAKIEKAWGKLVDEGGGAKVKLDGEKLVLTLPAGERVLQNGGKDSKKVPYLFKEVEGDFIAEVTLIRHDIPEKSVNESDFNPPVAFGLIVVFDANTVMNFNRSFPIPDSSQFRAMFHSTKMDWPTSGNTSKGDTRKPFTLRLTRRNDRFRFDYASDPDKTPWITLTEYGNLLAARATKVGIYAEHSVNAATSAVFEDFKITKPKS